MIVRKIALLAVMLCAVIEASAQTEKNLVMTPNRPFLGDQITLAYHPDSAMLATGKPVKGVAYYYDSTYRWSVADIQLDKEYKATIQLPPAAGFVAFKFMSGNVVDNNNDSAYLRMIFHKDGSQSASAYAGYCLLRAPRYNMGIPDYFQSYNISDTAVFFWMGNEITRFKGGARPLVFPYIRSGVSMGITSSIRRAASYMLHLADPTEKELYETMVAYEQYLKEPAIADSLKKALSLRSNILQKKEAYHAAVVEKDADKRLSLWKDFVKDFPASYAIDEAAGIDYGKAYRDIFSISIAYQDTAVLRKYVGSCPFMMLPLVYYKMVEIPYADWKKMSAKEAYTFAQPIMERFQQLKATQPEEYWYYGKEEWKDYCDKLFGNNYITYARILKETGREKEALAMAAYAQQLFQYNRSELNEVEAALLQKAGKKQELSLLLRNSIRTNQASALIFDMLKKEYGKSEGFDDYLASFKDVHTVALMKEHIKAAKIKIPAAAFSLADQQTSLASLKGKVVILDFWATWCAPCKAAMPGMKMAQERFKHDTNVVFFFVDTQERMPDYKEKAKAFILEKKYPFQVLFDKGEETYAAYAKLIKTSGIPFKVVIDGSGDIRFAEVGYMGSPSGLADEISTMIELTKE